MKKYFSPVAGSVNELSTICLFLENPLDKIDEQNSKEILDFLCDEKQPWTLVVVSKNNYWKQICKQTIVLNQGALKTN